MDLLKLLQRRRSIRKYKDVNISEQDLEKILQAGLLSPSGKGLKSFEFIVIKDKEVLEKLSYCKTGVVRFLKDADTAIAVLGDSKKSDTWIEDCSIAIYNMHLMATFLDLGSCWVQGRARKTENGIDTEDFVREILKFPENYKLLAILALGVPAQELAENPLEKLELEKIHKEKF